MDIRQVRETIEMIEEQNFDIRTITMGISSWTVSTRISTRLRRKCIPRLSPRPRTW